MNAVVNIIRRELSAYFATPVAYVFIVIFLVLTGVFTFYLGGFYERGIADLDPFFRFHPWLYLFLVPALAEAFRLATEVNDAMLVEWIRRNQVRLHIRTRQFDAAEGLLESQGNVASRPGIRAP